MKTSDFDYFLPPQMIAQIPVEPRDMSRLLVLDRQTGKIEHRLFRDIGEYFRPGDVLVLNQTRVIPARIITRKPTGGRVEILLIKRLDLVVWECIVGGKGLSKGKVLAVENGPSMEIMEMLDGSRRLVRFEYPIEPFLPKVGQMPLPPYIHENLVNQERYQTVYSRIPGSAAAPTAGLHFTTELLQSLREIGVILVYVTLHVGLDTFLPVVENDPLEHKIHSEWCDLPKEAADLINQAHLSGRKVIAVGTTTVRTLESSVSRDEGKKNLVIPSCGPTSLFILPGYNYKCVDVMITNFHLPKSSLIMLVSAFAGREQILDTYAEAIRQGYRFYSFGDAMLIL